MTLDEDVEVPDAPLVHLRHPVDNLPVCATFEDAPALTNDPEAVTCAACLDAL